MILTFGVKLSLLNVCQWNKLGVYSPGHSHGGGSHSHGGGSHSHHGHNSDEEPSTEIEKLVAKQNIINGLSTQDREGDMDVQIEIESSKPKVGEYGLKHILVMSLDCPYSLDLGKKTKK